MATLMIKDTGKTDTSSSTATLTRAYGDTGDGTELTIKGAELTANFETMITDDSPILKSHLNIDTSYFEYGKSDRVGVQLPVWTMRLYINRDSETDMITFGRLIFMGKTKGYKELYSATDSSTWKDIIAYSKYGEREATSKTIKTIKYINVSIKSISITQSTDKGFYCTVNMVETA